jgi:hypothetical protein
MQSRLMQWNTVKIHATYSMEEALGLIDFGGGHRLEHNVRSGGTSPCGRNRGRADRVHDPVVGRVAVDVVDLELFPPLADLRFT